MELATQSSVHFIIKCPDNLDKIGRASKLSKDLELELSIYAIKRFGEVSEGDVQVLALFSAFSHHLTHDEYAIRDCASAFFVASLRLGVH